MSISADTTLMARSACMECRRLKTKCDRLIPCTQCRKRGCENICPTGLRSRGSRNPSAEVEMLNRNIESMSARIRELEGALYTAQVQSSSDETPSPPPPRSNYDSSNLSLASITRNNYEQSPDPLKWGQILSRLPSADQGRALIDAYFSNYGWMMSPVSQPYCVNVLFARAYAVPRTASIPEISALLALFAIAMAGDGSLGVQHASAELYELSLEALHLHDALNSKDIATIEAMALQSCFLSILWDGDDVQKSWNYAGTTVRKAYGMELHRDPELQGMKEEECLRRRRLFHELASLDIWQSLLFQRPPSVQYSVASTALPHDTMETLRMDPAFFRWKYTFCRDVLIFIMNDVVCARDPPTYAKILEIDKRARECLVPPNLQFVDLQTASTELILQEQCMGLVTELAICRLHKDSFLLALEESPDDPFQHFAGHSVSTILYYTMAQLKRLRFLTTERPGLLPGLKRTWEVVGASLSFLSTFLRCVNVGPTAERAYMEFELGCKMVMDQASGPEHNAKLLRRISDSRQAVLQVAPHLKDGLRQTLAKMKWDGPTGNEPVAGESFDFALGYPLGARDSTVSGVGSSRSTVPFTVNPVGSVYRPELPPMVEGFRNDGNLTLPSVINDPYLANYFSMQDLSSLERESMALMYDSDPGPTPRESFPAEDRGPRYGH
ncbi:hypothetical protein FRC14_006157 [Serendipita sp. 396]|nr:hypothetical protein FRC14_006157 [Serendipita sp. 396]KAG8834863.1 hypothetical protein FRC18_001396 [Serendipita sp. 400]